MKIPTTKRPGSDDVRDENGLLPFRTLQEVLDRGAELDAWYDERIIFDRSNNTCTLLFDYPYEIDLDRIKTAMDMFEWTLHLLEKGWLQKFDVTTIITRISEFKKIKIYRHQPKAER